MGTTRMVAKKYSVLYSLRGNPKKNNTTIITAPSMQFIRDNWFAISGGKPLVIQKITYIR